METLFLGCKPSKYVLTLKIALNKLGYNLAMDKEFDKATYQAVKDFQKKNKLLPDGIVGEGQTWVKLLGRCLDWVFIHTSDSFLETSPKSINQYDINVWGLGGYHYQYTPDGKEHNFYPITQITAGVMGMNSNSIHLTWVGGREYIQNLKGNEKTYPISGVKSVVNLDNHTLAQEKSISERCKKLLEEYPHLIFLGHNQAPLYKANGKLCPLFDAREFLSRVGIPKENIYQKDTWGCINFQKTGVWA